MNRTSRALSFLLLALLAGAADAQGHSYLIERLEVRGLAHVSSEIVLDESRLVAGHTYSEVELRGGIDRIRRLPFILDAELSLEKGSARGAYILVITVDEARPVFYSGAAMPVISARDIIFRAADEELAVGARRFLGARTMVHIGALTRSDDRPDSTSHQIGQIGLTRFGLLDGRAFATITLNRSFPGGGNVVPGLVAGMYLGHDRTLTLTFEELDTDFSERRERVAQLRFARNTTDDPFFPDRGSVMAIAPLWLERDVTVTRLLEQGETPVHTRATGIESEIARYWALNDRWTLGAEAEGGYLDAEVEIGDQGVQRKDSFYGSLRTRLSWEIHSSSSSDSRAELSLRSVSDRDHTFRLRSGYHQLSVGWARRDAWGTVRVGVGYAW